MVDEYRKERIERLLSELRYEVTRGMMDGEIEEELGFRFLVPVSKHFKRGAVTCEFRTRPVVEAAMLDPLTWGMGPDGARLRIIQGGKHD